MENPSFFYRLIIREHHLDAFGHVNHAKYLEILEEARWQIITERNYGLEKVLKTQLAPVILSLNINYLKELKLREEIAVTTQVLNFSKRIGKLQQKIIKLEAGSKSETVAATAEITMGIMDLRTRKLVAPNEEWRFALGLIKDPALI
jgi:acyl-CoA thioester hydrolase